jgi:extracellular matrix regulatory protein A
MKGKEKYVPEKGFIHIGYGHLVPAARVGMILVPGSSPLKKLRERAAAEARLVDATNGHKTRAIIITDSNHVILSAVTPETLWQRAVGGAALISFTTVEDLEREGACRN